MIQKETAQKKKSQAAINRLKGVHQIEEQKQEILKNAESLFLEKGIENTTMMDIARSTGITKATLYRYFPNREEIAIQIQLKMLEKMLDVLGVNMAELSLENTGKIVRNMIDNFTELRDAFRFIGFFDRTYLNNTYESQVSQQAREQVCRIFWANSEIEQLFARDKNYKKIIMLTNAATSFCESIALRGELYWSIPGVEVSETLDLFKDMLTAYIQSILAEEKE